MTQPLDTAGSRSRRNLLLGASVLGAGYFGLRWGIPRLNEAFGPDFEFTEIADPIGFRRMTSGASTSGFDPFFGITGDGAAEAAAVVSDVRTRLCGALFDDPAPSSNLVPVASFSDYNCPFCRVLTERLVQMQSAQPSQIAVTWHELPLLGEASVMAARGALAAKRQGAYIEFHRRLMKSRFQATPQYLSALADDLGVDQSQLVSDMQSDAIAAEIEDSRALATIFGFIGTPALIVGRTVVQGEISESRLQRLVDRELSDGPIEACT
ncbi:MAG: DsbA family protein [Paracoccaceae bacterium]|nr:DsbA family protein [Paracoccaceae bacterium]